VLLVLHRVPRREAGRVAWLLGRALGTSLANARVLTRHLPVTVPQAFEPAVAERLRAELSELGAEVGLAERVGAPAAACTTHPGWFAEHRCARCATPICWLCAASSRGHCSACHGRRRRSRAFFALRVSLLSALLLVVLLWALGDVRGRHARTLWEGPLGVALVMLSEGPIDEAAIELLRERTGPLEGRIRAEATRYRALPFAPFSFHVFGPLAVTERPPEPAGDSVWALGRYAFDLWRYRRGIDRAIGLRSGEYDSVLYVLARAPTQARRQAVEGISQHGGRVGFVQVDLDSKMVDFALFVVTHELLHTLGASDQYDERGFALIPSGLPEPDRVPLWPQPRAEVMARNRVLGPGQEEPPETLDELGVGPATARQIGWLR
jgi:hypothetical protein